MPRLLVIAETDGARIHPSTLAVITFAQQWAAATGGTFTLLVAAGTAVSAEDYRGFGVETIYLASHSDLSHPTADRVAALCVEAVRTSGADSVAGPASSFGRDVLPRVAGLLDLPMLSDVMSVEAAGGLQFRRPMYAGNIIATVQVAGDRGVFSVRGTSFDKPENRSTATRIEELPVVDLPSGTTWISLEGGEQKRPDLSSARVVVSGGRPLRDAETFERLLGGLADKLGGAVGATRAAVDSGIAPNELQVGQTGKVVAPDLYIAAGVSGSVQHLAGMKDSKVIVAINTDPDAPIFEIADYGLVQDLHTAIPELISKL
jgi:electron transfer flavoprotein alpha subunit